MKNAIDYFDLIHFDFSKGSQSLDYVWIGHYLNSGQKVRVEIKRDCYDNQSYWRCSVWDEGSNEWHVAIALPANTFRNAHGCSYTERLPFSDDTEMAFHLDRDELLNIVVKLF